MNNTPKDIGITVNKAVADEENKEYDVDQQFASDGNESTDDDEDEDYYNNFIYCVSFCNTLYFFFWVFQSFVFIFNGTERFVIKFECGDFNHT